MEGTSFLCDNFIGLSWKKLQQQPVIPQKWDSTKRKRDELIFWLLFPRISIWQIQPSK